MDAPSNDDVRTLVESARDEALMERRRQNLLVDRETSLFVSWTCERLDLPARGLLSRGVSHHGVVPLSNLLRLHSNVRLLCP